MYQHQAWDFSVCRLEQKQKIRLTFRVVKLGETYSGEADALPLWFSELQIKTITTLDTHEQASCRERSSRSKAWWHRTAIPAFPRWRQEDCKFKASWAYTGRPEVLITHTFILVQCKRTTGVQMTYQVGSPHCLLAASLKESIMGVFNYNKQNKKRAHV